MICLTLKDTRMNDLQYGYLVCTNEIKPKFPPKVQAIWDACGTHVTSMEAEQGAKEIEHFVATLLESMVLDFNPSPADSIDYRDYLIKKGYIYE